MVSIYSHPDYKAAEEKLAEEGKQGLHLARTMQRDVKSTRNWDEEKKSYVVYTDPAQPKLSRLRGSGASRVKRWMWGLTERDTIRYDGSTLALHIAETFEAAIPALEADLEGASEKTRIRLETCIDELREHAEAIRNAEQETKDVRARLNAEEEARYKVNDSRGLALHVWSGLVSEAFDLANNLGIEDDRLPAFLGINLAGLLGVIEQIHEALVQQGHGEARAHVQEALEAMKTRPLRRRNIATASLALDAVKEMFPLV